MFDRFSTSARSVMSEARRQAQRFHHDHIGPDHIFLGLTIVRPGAHEIVLRKLQMDLDQLRADLESRLNNGTTLVTMNHLPFIPDAKKVLEFALEESRGLHHNHLGPMHLLLGIAREENSLASRVLRDACVRVEDLREEYVELQYDALHHVEEERLADLSRKESRGSVRGWFLSHRGHSVEITFLHGSQNATRGWIVDVGEDFVQLNHPARGDLNITWQSIATFRTTPLKSDES